MKWRRTNFKLLSSKLNKNFYDLCSSKCVTSCSLAEQCDISIFRNTNVKYLFTKVYGIIFQKTVILIINTRRNWHPIIMQVIQSLFLWTRITYQTFLHHSYYTVKSGKLLYTFQLVFLVTLYPTDAMLYFCENIF